MAFEDTTKQQLSELLFAALSKIDSTQIDLFLSLSDIQMAEVLCNTLYDVQTLQKG